MAMAIAEPIRFQLIWQLFNYDSSTGRTSRMQQVLKLLQHDEVCGEQRRRLARAMVEAKSSSESQPRIAYMCIPCSTALARRRPHVSTSHPCTSGGDCINTKRGVSRPTKTKLLCIHHQRPRFPI